MMNVSQMALYSLYSALLLTRAIGLWALIQSSALGNRVPFVTLPMLCLTEKVSSQPAVYSFKEIQTNPHLCGILCFQEVIRHKALHLHTSV